MHLPPVGIGVGVRGCRRDERRLLASVSLVALEVAVVDRLGLLGLLGLVQVAGTAKQGEDRLLEPSLAQLGCSQGLGAKRDPVS